MISACISTCFQRVIPWERARREGLRAGKGFFLAPSIVTPQLLDGVLIQRLAGSRFAESLVETTLSFHPAPDTLSFRGGEKAEEKGHPHGAGTVIYGK